NRSVGCYIDYEEIARLGLFEFRERALDVCPRCALILEERDVVLLESAALGAHQEIAHGFGVFRSVLEIRDSIAIQVLIAVLITRHTYQHRPQVYVRRAAGSQLAVCRADFDFESPSAVLCAKTLERPQRE